MRNNYIYLRTYYVTNILENTNVCLVPPPKTFIIWFQRYSSIVNCINNANNMIINISVMKTQ